jgi:hypothetical protein
VRVGSMAALVVFLLLGLFASIQSRLQPSLNHPRVLLPYAVDDGSKSSVLLSAQCPSKCCFSWSTDRPDTALIETLHPDGGDRQCSTSARVTSMSLSKTRQAAVITAKDQCS